MRQQSDAGLLEAFHRAVALVFASLPEAQKSYAAPKNESAADLSGALKTAVGFCIEECARLIARTRNGAEPP
ncbi:MAG: hypothetical protein ACRD3W_31395, partial [Terriglobales bacterium]